jgi:malate dehydrogenase (oxaloacetate-decarboxylating)
VIASGACRVIDSMFTAAAEVLSEFAPSAKDKNGALYPVLEDVRTISRKVALAVGLEAQRAGLAPKTDVATLEEKVSRKMWGLNY